ncbi:MAG TPA: YdcF family protein [Spirochaetota bacterium]|nr:YdcF family protein [Spirochaetota bacterium]
MKRPGYRTILLTLLTVLILYWLPFIYITVSGQPEIISSIDKLPASDAALVFGTLVGKDLNITPLLKERLEAGIEILLRDKSRKIVVSNMKTASMVMARYMYEKGIDRELVEIDPLADDTPDTCRFERRNHPEKRRVIFVSQGFHLPRILYQCRQAGVEGTGFPAEKLHIAGREEYPLITKVTTRVYRYSREAGLTWLAVLGIYR